MNILSFFKGVAFLCFLLICTDLWAQSQCPSQIGYRTHPPGYPLLDIKGFYMLFPNSSNTAGLVSAEFGSNDPFCQNMYVQVLPLIGGSCLYDAYEPPNLSCTLTNPSGKITFSNGLVCHYDEGNLIPCGDFLVPCSDEILQFAKDLIAVPGANCKQWEGPCNSESEIYRNGAVAIGTNSPSGELAGYKLAVKGGIASEMLQICKGEWCDYVFSDSFHLMPLPEVAQYIQANRHLPGCTPGPVIEREGGFSLGDETLSQQQKIEETFLHLIALRKRIDALGTRVERLGLPKIGADVKETAFVGDPKKEMNSAEAPGTSSSPVLSIQCYPTKPATGDNTADGIGGIKVSGSMGDLLTVTWAGPVNGTMDVLCSDGVILLTGLKKGTYTVTVTISGSNISQTCTLIIVKGTPVSCGKLAEEPCKTEIFNLVKEGFSTTEPACQQWEGDPCSTTAHIYRSGNVSIGTSTGRSGYSLAVKGGIVTDRFFIQLCETAGWCDYVFDPDYPLADLYEVEQYIKVNRHLPGTITQSEVTQQGGIEMRSVKLDQQKKIEETYLYLIEMNKQLEGLKNRIRSFE